MEKTDEEESGCDDFDIEGERGKAVSVGGLS